MPQQPSPQPTPAQPAASSHLVLYLWGIAAIVVLLVGASVAYLRPAGANADYICTKVITMEGACTNGSWGAWQEVTSSAEGDVTTTVQSRTYTGTRDTSKTLTYLSGRTACAPGYSQGSNGEWGASWSGFHGGSIVTSSSACQIEQTQTITLTRRSGGSTLRRSIENTAQDTGETSQTSRDVGSIDELGAEDTSGALGAYSGVIEIDINAQPSLVRSGDTTTVTWAGSGVQACAVTSDDGDSWNGTSGSQTSKPIVRRTVFTASCQLPDEGGSVNATAEVNIVPVFNEN